MHGFIRASGAALIFFSLLVGSAFADDFDLKIDRAQTPQGKLIQNNLYALEITCTKRGGDLPRYNPSWGERQLMSAQQSRSHFIMISTAAPVSKVDPSAALNTSLALALSFSVDEVNGNNIDNRAGCSQSKLLVSPTVLKLTTGNTFSKTIVPGTLAATFDAVTKAATSLALVFSGTGFSPNTSGTLNAINATAGPITNLISVFASSKSFNDLDTIDLGVGTTTITTPYSQITVVVRPVLAVATDMNTMYRTELQSRASAQTVTTTDLAGSCQVVANKLDTAGFHADSDLAFGMTFAALNTVTTKEQLYACLGDDYAKAAIALDQNFWKNVPVPLRLDSTVLWPSAPVPAGQPLYSVSLGIFTKNFTTALGTYAGTKAPSATQAAAVQGFVTSDVTVNDPYTVMNISPFPNGNLSLFDYLIGKGYQHFGFFAPITDTGLIKAYGAHIAFLAVHADRDANAADFSQLIGMFPVFQGHQIAYFFVTNDEDEIKAILGTRTSSGHGFQITNIPGVPSSGGPPTTAQNVTAGAATTPGH